MRVELYSKYMQNIISLKDIKIYTPQESNRNNMIPGLIITNIFLNLGSIIVFLF